MASLNSFLSNGLFRKSSTAKPQQKSQPIFLDPRDIAQKKKGDTRRVSGFIQGDCTWYLQRNYLVVED